MIKTTIVAALLAVLTAEASAQSRQYYDSSGKRIDARGRDVGRFTTNR